MSRSFCAPRYHPVIPFGPRKKSVCSMCFSRILNRLGELPGSSSHCAFAHSPQACCTDTKLDAALRLSAGRKRCAPKYHPSSASWPGSVRAARILQGPPRWKRNSSCSQLARAAQSRASPQRRLRSSRRLPSESKRPSNRWPSGKSALTMPAWMEPLKSTCPLMRPPHCSLPGKCRVCSTILSPLSTSTRHVPERSACPAGRATLTSSSLLAEELVLAQPSCGPSPLRSS
mmetsp:Transcript_20743/g.57413  ORF Transcript_20743/g.57413 Transcript_20743/m.57413 type:complete len:230 (-) Transcript_20743:1346-2035(-)